MTTELIGQSLDEEIGVKIMRWKPGNGPPPPFSTNQLAAYDLKDEMEHRGYLFFYGYDTQPFALFVKGNDRYTAWHEKLPMAICLAALSALEGDAS